MPESAPNIYPDQSALKLPIAFAGGLSLIGYDLKTNQTLDLVTYWQVDQPLVPPLSIFAHAVDANQQVMAQADGLNVRVSSLEPGDIIIQRLPVGAASTATSINLGVYDTGHIATTWAGLKFGVLIISWCH